MSGSIGNLIARERERDLYSGSDYPERLVMSNPNSIPSQQDSYDESNISESDRSVGKEYLGVNSYGPRLPDVRKLRSGTHASLV